ncbi:MAG: TatD family hydrolase [Magnetococcales bacterium]|nr:TatD family hydrolase [Magnetococcales bacterium]NGZ07406.1 TatD family hydrolase [Magnetococcales bacterium]
MFDTHCHLDFPDFAADRLEVWSRARAVGVQWCLVPGVRVQDFARIVAMQSGEIGIGLGLHPGFLEDHGPDGVEQLETWIRHCPPVAVGEIGLDYLLSPESHAAQWQLLERQLRLAGRLQLPVVLHVRRAHDPMIGLIKQLGFAHGGIVHAFSGSPQQAVAYVKLGFCLGFGGVVTHERAKRVRQVAAHLPEESLVLETDAPDLPPAGHAGERNEPGFLPEVVRVLARLRQVEVERIMEVTTHNARRVLAWPS